MLPYGKQTIESDDVQAVTRVLESDWLTTGPVIERFESALASLTGTKHAVAVCNGTAALHAAMAAAQIEPGDEVIVPAITFVATANAVVYQGGTPVFADVDPRSMLLDPADVARKITPRTKAVVAVDYAGQPCDYGMLRPLCEEFELILIADACHSLGASYQGHPTGSLADISCFSFHPVKPITCGEGGGITTDDDQIAQRLKDFRNHGIESDFRQRDQANQHVYDMVRLGHNFRLTDFQCALAESQLAKLPRFWKRRNEIVQLYDNLFDGDPHVTPLTRNDDRQSAHHLYAIRWNSTDSGITRDEVFSELRRCGIGANVHYRPVYQHTFYRSLLGNVDHQCPNAESGYEEILSLPVFPGMSRRDVAIVVATLKEISPRGRQQSAAA